MGAGASIEYNTVEEARADGVPQAEIDAFLGNVSAKNDHEEMRKKKEHAVEELEPAKPEADAAGGGVGVEEEARGLPSQSSVFDVERGCGAMITMEGGVVDQVLTGAAEAAEYGAGEQIAHDGKALFIIDAVLGNGAFGAVYKATPVGGGAALALKSVKPSLSPEKKREFQVQLAAESAICFAIGAHAHIVSVRRVLATPRGLVIAMDLVEGTDLRAHAGKAFRGPLYLGGRAEVNARVNSLVAQLYMGLAHLHDRAVLHMDIKPEVCAHRDRACG